MRAPGVPVARADGEAGPAIKRRRRVEIADGVHDMVEPSGHPAVVGLYFSAEKAVGTSNWLTILPMIWPSASELARADIQSGSAWKAVHFLSRSASDSQASM